MVHPNGDAAHFGEVTSSTSPMCGFTTTLQIIDL